MKTTGERIGQAVLFFFVFQNLPSIAVENGKLLVGGGEESEGIA